MRVGNLTETIIVTGESPVVDVQSTRREAVIDGDVISVAPGHALDGVAHHHGPRRGNLRCRTEPVAGAGLLLRQGRAEQRRPLQRERHAGRQRVRGRRRVVLDLRHRERRRNRVHGGRRHGRDRRGRTGAQHRPAVGRQHVPGTGLHQLFERRTAGQQSHAGADGADARAEPPRDAGHHQGVRRQHLLWRAHRARSPVVLRQLSKAEHGDRRRGRRRKRERVQPLEMGLGGGSEPDRPQFGGAIDLHRAPHGAGRRETPRLGQLGVPAAMRRDTAQGRDRRLSHPRRELGCRDSDVVARGIPQLPRCPVYRRAGPLDEPDDEPSCCWKPAAPTTRIATPAVSCPFPPTAFSTSA